MIEINWESIFNFLYVDHFGMTLAVTASVSFITACIILIEKSRPKEYVVYVKGLDGEWHLDPNAKVEVEYIRD